MRNSHNRIVLKSLMRIERQLSIDEIPESMRYLILYSFFYKYVSDRQKNLLFSLLPMDMGDLKALYLTKKHYDDFKKESFKELGYFINDVGAYMDVMLDEDYANPYFPQRFLNTLKRSIEFNSPQLKEYFEGIFEAFNENFKDDMTKNNEMFIREYVNLVSKLNLNDIEFNFRQVFDVIASSRILRIKYAPEYIRNILKHLILSQRDSSPSIYDPFMRDGSCLLDIAGEIYIENVYGKEPDTVTYLYCLIKALINDCNSKNISFLNENAFNSMAIGDKTFDIIVSKLPNPSRHFEQFLETPNKTNDLKDDILLKIKDNNLKADSNVMDALNNLIKEVEAVRSEDEITFEGQYESLNDSEFLFLINMLNMLKNDGLMIVSVSQNFLFKKSLTLLRKFLTYENNYIDAIISIPDGFSRAVRPEVVIVFRKNKRSDDIVFIDISKVYETERSRNAVPGLLRHNLVLKRECLDLIVDIYSKRRVVDRISEVISINQLKHNDFNLSVSRYVDTYEGEFVKLSELSNEKKELDLKMDELNKKIEKMMGDLDIRL